MKITIYNKYNDEIIGTLELRKNTTHKTIIDKIKTFISEKYNCNVTRLLPTGKIDFETGLQDITHILFGEHLPFRQIYFIRGG
jgi:hypothetical protein